MAGFDCVSLDPTQFKELFRRHFGVLLTAQELGILVRAGNMGEWVNSVAIVKTSWHLTQRHEGGTSSHNALVTPSCIRRDIRGFSPVIFTTRGVSVLPAMYGVRFAEDAFPQHVLARLILRKGCPA